MATYILVPGADGTAWYWHLVVTQLRDQGHTVVTVSFPADDSAGLDAFADAIISAVRSTAPGLDGPVVLVAQSLGGFSAPLICDRVPVDRIVLVNAMVPRPGESAGSGGATPGRPRPDPRTRRRSVAARTPNSTCARTSSTMCRPR